MDWMNPSRVVEFDWAAIEMWNSALMNLSDQIVRRMFYFFLMMFDEQVFSVWVM